MLHVNLAIKAQLNDGLNNAQFSIIWKTNYWEESVVKQFINITAGILFKGVLFNLNHFKVCELQLPEFLQPACGEVEVETS